MPRVASLVSAMYASGTKQICHAKAAPIALLIPAKQFGSPQIGRITYHLVEGGAVNNLHVPSSRSSMTPRVVKRTRRPTDLCPERG
jgi:hypothetical protein